MSYDYDDDSEWDEIQWTDDIDWNWDEVELPDQMPLSDIEWDALELGFTVEELERLGALDFIEIEDANRRGMFVSLADAQEYEDEIPVPTEIYYNEEFDYYEVIVLYDSVHG